MVMIEARPLPPCFDRYHEIGGVLEFRAFEMAASVDPAIAVDGAFAHDAQYDGEALKALPPRPLDRRGFLGAWWDERSAALVRRGDYRTADGRELTDPLLRDLDETKITNGSWSPPEPPFSGEFAYAFSQPPYPLDAKNGEVQALFDSILAFILPDGQDHEILDWSSPELPKMSSYFRDGTEWWGVFLFTIRVPALARITVVSGSATD